MNEKPPISSQNRLNANARRVGKALPNTPELQASFAEIVSVANGGLRLKQLLRQIFFGLSLANAIENWFASFDASEEKKYFDRVPRSESKQVVAAWMRFELFKSVIITLLTFSIAIVTVIFLSRQISSLKAQTNFLREQDRRSIEIENLTYLFDSICIRKCTPKYNIKIRQNAFSRYLDNIEKGGNISDNLSYIQFSGFSINSQNFLDVVFDHANFEDAEFEKSHFLNISFKEANLESAHFRNSQFLDIDFAEAIMDSTKIDKSYLNNIRFYKANTDDMIIRDSYLTNTIIRKSDERTSPTNAVFDNCIIDSQKIALQQWSEVDIENSLFLDITIDVSSDEYRNSNWSNNILIRTDIDGRREMGLGYPIGVIYPDISGMNFQETRIVRSKFESVKYSGDLSSTEMKDIIFLNSDFSEAEWPSSVKCVNCCADASSSFPSDVNVPICDSDYIFKSNVTFEISLFFNGWQFEVPPEVLSKIPDEISSALPL